MKRICARWVSPLLSTDQKCDRILIFQARLDRFKQNKMDFKRRFITVEET